MKVLQILPELNSGGVERGTLEIAAALVDKGHEALVVSNGGRMLADLKCLGARHVALPIHEKSIRTFGQVRVLRKMIEAESPDILHIRSRVPGWVAWLAWRGIKQERRPRLVSTVHGFYSVNRYSAVMLRGERIIAVSESVKTYILKNYPRTDESKIRVIHRGVDRQTFPAGLIPGQEWLDTWRKEQPDLEGKKLLLLAGRITRWKGHEDFLRLIAAMKAEGQAVHGLIAGDTHPRKKEYEVELRTMSRELQIGNDVSFLGHRNDVREVMAMSDVVLSLSKQAEAFGRVTLEAAALGRPVVAYDHGGVGEQLRAFFPEGLVALGDEARLKEVVKKRLDSEDCPLAIPEAFQMQTMLDKTMAVYAELLSA